MTDCAEDLRLAIVGSGDDGERRTGFVAMRRNQRRRFRHPRRLWGRVAFAALGLAAAVGAGWMMASPWGDRQEASVEPSVVVSAASGVQRSSAPSALSPPELSRSASTAGTVPYAPPRPIHTAGERPRLDADRLLAEAAAIPGTRADRGVPAPVRRDLADWASGPCAAKPQPRHAGLCVLDGTLYTVREMPAETRALFAFARAIGTHAALQMGLLYDPVAPDTEELRTDCLAGIWAGGSARTRAWLNPDRLALALDPEGTGGWEARRVAAFRAGYRAGDAMTCNRPLTD